MPSELPSVQSIATDIINELSRITPPKEAEDDASGNEHQASDQSASNPLTSLPSTIQAHARSLLTTLHVLFPHELIPALDILDRKLVLILAVRSSQRDSSSSSAFEGDLSAIYVRSASSVTHSTRGSTRGYGYGAAGYETAGGYYSIHLASWNCSCPAFAFSAFGRTLNLSSSPPTSTTTVGTPNPNTTATTSSTRPPEFSNPPHQPPSPDTRDDSSPSQPWHFGGTLPLPPKTSGIGTPACKHILAAALAEHAPELFGHGLEKREVSGEEFAAWSAGWGD